MLKTLHANSARWVLGKLLLGGFLMMPLSSLIASPVGFDYRSRQSGDWTSVNSWERRAFGSQNSWQLITLASELPNSTAGTILIRDGHNITLSTNITADQLTVQGGGTMTINSGVTLTIADNPADGNDLIVAGASATSQGVVVNAGSIVAATGAGINFAGTSIYKHNYTTTFGTIPTATWAATSTLEVIGYTATPSGSPAGFGQLFGNIRWNTPLLTGDVQLQGALTSNVRGNFEVVNTNGRQLILNGSNVYQLTILGSLDVSNNAVLNISNGTLAGNTSTLVLRGSLNVASGGTLLSSNSASPSGLTFAEQGISVNGAGTINTTNIDVLINSLGTVTLNRGLSMASGRTLTVGGRLNMGNQVISGAGNFSLNTAGILGVGSAAGITAGTALAGNIHVTGTRTFRASTYVYNGTVAQVTGDGLPVNVDKFEINNPAGVTLTAHLNLNTLLTFSNGVIKTAASSNLTVKNTASISYPPADKSSFVEGPVRITVLGASSTITFPVGTGMVYTPIKLEANQVNAALSTIYEAQEFKMAAPIYPITGTQTNTNSIDRVSQVRYFKIVAYNTNFDYGLVTLPVGADDMVRDFNTLSVAGVEGRTWYDFGQTSVTGTTFSGTITSDYIFGLGEFALANKIGGTNPLPVSLKAFAARKKDAAVILDWITASEKNNAGFEVQRSRDAKNFEVIANVAGAGTSNTENRYQFLDQRPMAGVSYYRLKQIDLDGSFTYSEIISVQNANVEGSVSVYPNPAISQVNVALAATGGAKVRVMNMVGQVVLQQSIAAGAGKAVLQVADLPAGTYTLFVEQEGRLSVSKIIKQ